MFGCDITNLEYLIYSDLKNLIKKKRKKMQKEKLVPWNNHFVNCTRDHDVGILAVSLNQLHIYPHMQACLHVGGRLSGKYHFFPLFSLIIYAVILHGYCYWQKWPPILICVAVELKKPLTEHTPFFSTLCYVEGVQLFFRIIRNKPNTLSNLGEEVEHKRYLDV